MHRMRRATYALVVTSVVYWEGHMCEAVSERAVSRVTVVSVCLRPARPVLSRLASVLRWVFRACFLVRACVLSEVEMKLTIRVS